MAERRRERAGEPHSAARAWAESACCPACRDGPLWNCRRAHERRCVGADAVGDGADETVDLGVEDLERLHPPDAIGQRALKLVVLQVQLGEAVEEGDRGGERAVEPSLAFLVREVEEAQRDHISDLGRHRAVEPLPCSSSRCTEVRPRTAPPGSVPSSRLFWSDAMRSLREPSESGSGPEILFPCRSSTSSAWASESGSSAKAW